MKHELYLRFRCRYRTIHVFPDADPNGRRDELWDRDVAEVFLQPDRFGEKYYKEFEVSPNGQWLDLDITPQGLRHITSGMRSSVRVDESKREWTADLAIPMGAITAQLRSRATVARELLPLRGSRPAPLLCSLAADWYAGAELPRAAKVWDAAFRRVISAAKR